MDGVVPISCQPIEISGRNWISRRAAAEAIRHDPEWNNGNYEKNPSHYIWTAAANSLRTESATRIQELAPTRAAADALYEERLAQAARGDANDSLWAIEAIMDYNPEPDLDKITAKVLLINAEEDEANPPELGTVERAMKRAPRPLCADPGGSEYTWALHPFLRRGLEALPDRVHENPRRPARGSGRVGDGITYHGHARRTGGTGDRRQQGSRCRDRAPIRGGGGARRCHLRQ
jgi:hypothetical protein